MVRENDIPGSRDDAIARIAGRQHGIVTYRQLLGCRLSSAAISKRVRAGRLHRVHRGVYSLIAAPTEKGTWMAAVLACGPGAALSHRSAAALWGLLPAAEGPVEVSVPTANGRASRRGIRVHRCPTLAAAALERPDGRPPVPAVTRREGIPVTAPWRTLEDLRRSVPPRQHRRALRGAELRRFALPPTVRGDRTRSELERDFLRLCRRHRLPAPEVNKRLGPWTVDCVWEPARLVVEVDAWGTHGGSVAFEDDHARDLDLRRRGYSVHRYTASQTRHRPDLVVADLRERLAAGGKRRGSGRGRPRR